MLTCRVQFTVRLLAPVIASSLLAPVLAACTAATGTDIHTAPAKPKASAACPEFAVQPNGSCCAAGAIWDAATYYCRPVGPPECATTVLADPEACVPQYCAFLVAGAVPKGRGCTDAELAAHAGCAAGSFRDADSGQCRPAGQDAATVAALGWRQHPAAQFPAPTALPAADQTWFCGDGPGTPARLCAATDPPCSAAATTDCQMAGEPLVCPPSFEPMASTDGVALPTCQPSESACGAAPYGDNLPDGPKIYALQAAADGGDGSPDKPFNTLLAALKFANAGKIVVLGAGTWTAPLLTIKGGSALHGRCAKLVTLQEPDAASETIAIVGKGNIVLHGVHLAGGAVGVRAVAGGKATISGVWFDHQAGGAVRVDGAGSSITLTDSYIDSPKPAGNDAVGANVTTGGSLELQHVRVRAARSAGIAASGAATLLSGKQLVIDATAPVGLGKLGLGIRVDSGAQATLQSVTLANNFGAGLLADSGAEVTLTQAVVRGTRGGPGILQGDGIVIVNGAELQGSALRIADNQRSGVFVESGTATATLSATVISDTAISTDGVAGMGLFAGPNSHTTATGLQLVGNHNQGMYFAGEGTTFALSGVLVQGNRVQGTLGAFSGCGIVAREHAVGSVQWARVTDSDDCGLAADGTGTSIEGDGIMVDHLAARQDMNASGRAVDVHSHGTAHLSRLLVWSVPHVGVAVLTGASATITGLAVVGVTDSVVQQQGIGVAVSEGATLHWTGGSIDQANGVGLMADRGAQLQGADLAIRHTRFALSGLAAGMLVQLGAVAVVTGVDFTDNLGGVTVGGGDAHLSLYGALAQGTADIKAAPSGGLIAYDHGALALANCLVRDVGGLGVGVFGADLDIFDTVIRSVHAAAQLSKARSQLPEMVIADGIFAAQAHGLMVQRSLIADVSRAGMAVVQTANGVVQRVAITGSYFGIAEQDAVGPLQRMACAVFGNQQNFSGGQGLAQPDAPKLAVIEL